MAQDVDFVALIEEYRAGNEQARDALVERYMPLVRSLAARYSGRGEPQEDRPGGLDRPAALDRALRHGAPGAVHDVRGPDDRGRDPAALP